MTTLEICNMALSSLGHERRVTDLAAQTKEALLCSGWFATARRNVLSAAFWNGLTRRAGPFDGVPARTDTSATRTRADAARSRPRRWTRWAGPPTSSRRTGTG